MALTRMEKQLASVQNRAVRAEALADLKLQWSIIRRELRAKLPPRKPRSMPWAAYLHMQALSSLATSWQVRMSETHAVAIFLTLNAVASAVYSLT